MGIIDDGKLQNILPKYSELKLSGKNLAQQYVSAFNTGMNIYQCINQLQGYIEWVVKAVNDVVVQWNEIVDTQIKDVINASKQATTEQFNNEWENKQPELIEQVNRLTTNQFNNEWENKQPELIEQVNRLTTNQFNKEKSIFNDKLNALDASMDTLDASMDTLDASMDTLDARMDTLSNPNLLTNPDFKINQRGLSTYSSTAAGCTVDRWVGTNVKTDVNSDNTVTVSPLSGIGYYTQHEENISYGKHTYSIYAQVITGTVKAFYKSKDSKDIELGTLKQGLNTFTSVDDGFKSFFLSIAGGSSVTLKYAKVEQGSVATPFVAPNPAEELTKCYRFRYIGKAALEARCTESTIFGFTKDLPTKLRTKPTTTFKSKNSNNVNTVDVILAEENNAVYITGTAVNTNQTVINVVLDLDAEIY